MRTSFTASDIKRVKQLRADFGTKYAAKVEGISESTVRNMQRGGWTVKGYLEQLDRKSMAAKKEELVKRWNACKVSEDESVASGRNITVYVQVPTKKLARELVRGFIYAAFWIALGAIVAQLVWLAFMA